MGLPWQCLLGGEGGRTDVRVEEESGVYQPTTSSSSPLLLSPSLHPKHGLGLLPFSSLCSSLSFSTFSVLVGQTMRWVTNQVVPPNLLPSFNEFLADRINKPPSAPKVERAVHCASFCKAKLTDVHLQQLHIDVQSATWPSNDTTMS